jgi:hypothetical protein
MQAVWREGHIHLIMMMGKVVSAPVGFINAF